MAADPGSSWGLVEWAWPAIVTGLSVMSARIVYLQDEKIKDLASDVEACKARDADHASALAAHQLYVAQNHPSKPEMDKALDMQFVRIAELMSVHNANMIGKFSELSALVSGMLDRERSQRAGDRK